MTPRRGLVWLLAGCLAAPAAALTLAIRAPADEPPPRLAAAAAEHLAEALRWRFDLSPRTADATLDLAWRAAGDLTVSLRAERPPTLTSFSVPCADLAPMDLDLAAGALARRIAGGLARRWPALGSPVRWLPPLPAPTSLDPPRLAAARLAARQGDLRAACEAYQRLGTAPALLELALYLRRLDLDESAEAALRLALAADPEWVAARLALADLLRDVGDVADADWALRQAAQSARTADELAALAEVQGRWGRLADSLRTLERRAALLGGGFEATRAALGGDDLRRALAAFDRAEGADGPRVLAALLQRLGSGDSALRLVASWSARGEAPSLAGDAGISALWTEQARTLYAEVHRLLLPARATDLPARLPDLRRRADDLLLVAAALADDRATDAALALRAVTDALTTGGEAVPLAPDLRAAVIARLDAVAAAVGRIGG